VGHGLNMLPSLNSGDLRNRIELWRKTKVDDGLGGRSVQWTLIKKLWAEVVGLNGREAVLSQALQGISSYRIRVRFGSGVLDSDQIRFGAIVLNVKGPPADPNGLREQEVILADTESVEALPDA